MFITLVPKLHDVYGGKNHSHTLTDQLLYILTQLKQTHFRVYAGNANRSKLRLLSYDIGNDIIATVNSYNSTKSGSN